MKDISRKIVKFDLDLTERLIEGVNIIANAVKTTMGPKGRNVLIERPGQHPIVTKDGVTVAKSVNLSDQFKDLGVQIIKDASSRTAEEAGDGTTTSMVLAQTLYTEGLRMIAAGHDQTEIRNGMLKGSEIILGELKKLSKQINSKEELLQVALVSANGEQEIAELISNAIDQIGVDGVVTVEEAKGFKSSLSVVEGFSIDRGFLSPYFITDSDKMLSSFEKCLILICNKKFDSLKDIIKPLEIAAESGRPLLIIANDIEGDAMQGLVLNHVKGALKNCAIKSPGFGQARHEMLEDIAVLTNGKVFGEGDSFDNFSYEDFGQCKKVIVKRTSTLLVTGEEDSEAVKNRVQSIREQLDSEEIDEQDREVLSYRLKKLIGGVALLRVGASTEAEMIERKDRVDDALHATRAALEEGVLPGGGVALVRASKAITEFNSINSNQSFKSDYLIGLRIVESACKMPLQQIVKNTGRSSDLVLQKVLEGSKTFGYDARNEKYGDMIDLGILDPHKVVRCAVENAMSVASMLLSVGCAMIEDFDGKNNQ